jgi:hypothetical protein
MSGVKDRRNATRPAAVQSSAIHLEGVGAVVGKTFTKKRNDSGMTDAAAKAVLAQMMPQGVAA